MAASSLILASASPRRKELLQQLGVDFHCCPADVDETPGADEAPDHYVRRLAVEKAEAVFSQKAGGDTLVLAADTTVSVDGAILGKPRDMEDGLAILQKLSGRTHKVYTAICLRSDKGSDCEVVLTEVSFTSLTRETCLAYLSTEEPWDKAGAYGIQGLGGALVTGIRGSYSNVVGLPLHETWRMLKSREVATALAKKP